MRHIDRVLFIRTGWKSIVHLTLFDKLAPGAVMISHNEKEVGSCLS